MCGLFGALSWTEPWAPQVAPRALAALRHRGPDGQGVWRSPRGEVVLGHARLAVMDVEGGAQPLLSEDGQVVAVVNGELYGEQEARAALIARGHRFRTRSDSELLVHLYEEHGLEMFEHLRGEFAFLLWDARAERLIAARDRFGVKPLCLARVGDRLLFASEAKGLFAAGVPARWDRVSLLQALSLHYVLPGRTLFAGVEQLEPGCAWVVERSGTRRLRYWALSARAGEAAPLGDPVAEVRKRLEEAVHLRLRSDVPLACALSGGLDSSAVATIAARAGSLPPCFTVQFEGGPAEELLCAQEVAKAIGAPLHVVAPSARVLLEALPDAVERAEGLAANAHLPAKYLLARELRAAGHKAVLTGEGADEAFAGYAHLRQDLLEAEGRAGRAGLFASNGASAGLMLPEGDTLPLDAVRRRLGFVPTFLAAKAAFGCRVRALLSDDAVHGVADPFDALLDAFDLEPLRRRHPVERSLHLWTRLALANYILKTLGDGTEMAFGVEGRVPFLDHVLFEHAQRLPVDWKIRDGVEKHVLREAVRPLLPARVLAREKHPFVSPPVSLQGAAWDLVRDVLHSRAFAALPFFDAARARRWCDGLGQLDARARVAAEPVLFTMLSAVALQERLGLGDA